MFLEFDSASETNRILFEFFNLRVLLAKLMNGVHIALCKPIYILLFHPKRLLAQLDCHRAIHSAEPRKLSAVIK